MQGRSLAIAGLALALAIAGVTGPAMAGGSPGSVLQQDADGAPPRAEAGVDQTVQRNTTVLLDGTGSFSPEGEIVEYHWYVAAPDGSVVETECDRSDCALANFEPSQLGVYNVTLTVEDQEGRRQMDTMYVRAVVQGDFGVSLTGPADAGGSEANLTATVSPGRREVDYIAWYQGDRLLQTQNVSRYGGVFERSTYLIPGATYRVMAVSNFNQTTADSWAVPEDDDWVPAGPDEAEYPRIEGPRTILGSPTYIDTYGNWIFTGHDYTVVTGENSTVNGSTWTADGDGIPEEYWESGTTVAPELPQGPHRIVANLDMEREVAERHANHLPRNESMQDAVSTVHEEAVLSRQVVVDPAPQLNVSDLPAQAEETLAIKYTVEDAYNPTEEIRVTIGGEIAYTGPPSKGGLTVLSAPVPDGVYGVSAVRVSAIDGRGQTTTRSRAVTLPQPEPGEMGRDPIANLPSDIANHLGYSPPSTWFMYY